MDSIGKSNSDFMQTGPILLIALSSFAVLRLCISQCRSYVFTLSERYLMSFFVLKYAFGCPSLIFFLSPGLQNSSSNRGWVSREQTANTLTSWNVPTSPPRSNRLKKSLFLLTMLHKIGRKIVMVAGLLTNSVTRDTKMQASRVTAQ